MGTPFVVVLAPVQLGGAWIGVLSGAGAACGVVSVALARPAMNAMPTQEMLSVRMAR